MCVQPLGVLAAWEVTGVLCMSALSNRNLPGPLPEAIGREARALMNAGKAYSTLWMPVVNLARDPRWGRFQESISECPVLNAHYVRAFIRGIQGDGPVMKIAATCKHFYAYSLEDSDGFTRHDFDAVVSERDLRETYLVPFSARVAAGVASVMCSYNAVNNLPTCLDGHAQNGIRRGEFGFDGPIVAAPA